MTLGHSQGPAIKAIGGEKIPNMFDFITRHAIKNVGVDFMMILHSLASKHAYEMQLSNSISGPMQELGVMFQAFKERGVQLFLALDGDALKGKAAVDQKRATNRAVVK